MAMLGRRKTSGDAHRPAMSRSRDLRCPGSDKHSRLDISPRIARLEIRLATAGLAGCLAINRLKDLFSRAKRTGGQQILGKAWGWFSDAEHASASVEPE
jgi:hypothetical protein